MVMKYAKGTLVPSFSCRGVQTVEDELHVLQSGTDALLRVESR